MFKAASALVATTYAFSNSVPVMGNFPGWVNGEGRTGIEVNIYLDLLCSACQGSNPTWNEVLATEWLDGTVADQVYWTYTPFPLPYHVHTFQVTQVVPYLNYLCATEDNCLLNEYKDFCFGDIQSQVLGMTDKSYNEFIAYWSETVAAEFDLDADTLLGIYSYSTDTTNSDSNTRAMWKHAASRGVSGTPTVFINGVHIDDVPYSVSNWMHVLNDVYNSQYHAPAAFLQ